MKLLGQERELLERYLPGLNARLDETPLEVLEGNENPSINWYKEAGGAGLLVSEDFGGAGVSAVNMIKLTRAIASKAPSLALCTTMHQFSLASLIELSRNSDGPEWMLLDGIARDKLLMCSAFAEGRAGQSILEPTMSAVWDGNNWLVSGRKQPCSLARSMDLITASVKLEKAGQESVTGVALIPAKSAGISTEPFWQNKILAGTESDALVLDNVEVHPELVFELGLEFKGKLDDLQTYGFIWFELLLTTSYLGAAMSLVERVFENARGDAAARVALATELKGVSMLLDSVAQELDSGSDRNECLAHALIARYQVTDAIHRSIVKSVELLGGIAFIKCPEISYLSSAAQAISFHPPSRASAISGLHSWFEGNVLTME
ncbi:acyl-CoA dehydrogenase family protein [Pseudoalteromonas sp. OOF1S-7]|uniref:acyl-CoA dehydrogenase family protein n=1 Tax=Pseudoalteromonas sp. OOF1S-7 TaxID=2917757 RepID=UPI001EF62B84|nr:acyl-CoA dehydrogenase family protein [Pseudoalteromonas sp. OOF1S-7]MCG7537518.1 acyl-CoA/acyl-ACP dehydrogenase [Pseudoalteromonas sp. OOF1S-7]